MPHEQLSLEETWQLPMFSKPGKQGEAGAVRVWPGALGGLWEGSGGALGWSDRSTDTDLASLSPNPHRTTPTKADHRNY